LSVKGEAQIHAIDTTIKAIAANHLRTAGVDAIEHVIEVHSRVRTVTK
jgi:hypothetical protein